MAVNSNRSIALNLPPGAVRRVAAGIAVNGWAGIPGSYPAGTYLVRSNVACRANFTSAEAVTGYEAASFKNGDEIIINVPKATTYLEFQSLLDTTLLSSPSGNLDSSATTTFSNTHRPDNTTPYKRGLPVSSYGGYRASNSGGIVNPVAWLGHRGSFYMWNSTSGLFGWNPQSTNPTSIGTLNSTVNPTWNGNPQASLGNKNIATNGTRYVGHWNSTTQRYFYTDNPETNSGWTFASYPTLANYQVVSFIYGGDKFIVASIGTGYHYSFDGVTWTSATFPSIPTYDPMSNVTGLAYGNGVWVLFPYNFSSSYYTSTDGITWTTRDFFPGDGTNTSAYAWAVSFGNGRFVAQCNNAAATNSPDRWNAATSVDGINWQRSDVPNYYFNTGQTWTYARVTHSGTTFMASNEAVGGNNIEGAPFSIDGVSWFSAASNRSKNGYYNHNLKGTRGVSFMCDGWSLMYHNQRNAKFEVYLLDSGFITY